VEETAMRIEILGTGCARCNRLEAVARATADRLRIPYEIVHVRDIDAIVQRGVMTTPALVIDGRVVAAGRVPTAAELASWLAGAAG
jgi:small redox-active disulfide protein 2